MVNLVGLHGFWDAPGSFDALASILRPERIFVPDLFSQGPLDPSRDFDRWAENFECELEKRFGSRKVALAGYSQGGRLALHALLKYSGRFSKALLDFDSSWSASGDRGSRTFGMDFSGGRKNSFATIGPSSSKNGNRKRSSRAAIGPLNRNPRGSYWLTLWKTGPCSTIASDGTEFTTIAPPSSGPLEPWIISFWLSKSGSSGRM